MKNRIVLPKDFYEKFITNQGYEISIIDYKGANNCTIEFNDKHKTILHTIKMEHVRKGNIKNPFHPLVWGIGYLGIREYKKDYDIELKPTYKKWNRLLERGYSKTLKEKYPTYKDIVVCEDWHNFQNFAEWYEENYKEGFQLDKDILIKGNKIYSEDTCCFVPYEINNLLSSNRKSRGDTPIGVSFHTRDNKYQAYLNTGVSRVSLGYFISMTKAFQAYKEAKEQYIKEVANRWKDQIEPRAYEALMNYQVEITD